MTVNKLDDPVRRLVASKIQELGLDMAVVSRQIGKNHAYIFQYLTKGSPRWLPEDVRPQLAGILGVTEESLRKPDNPDEPLDGRAIQNSPLYKSMTPNLMPAAQGEKVPVMGVGEGGADGEVEWNGEIVEYVARPEALVGVPNAYAAYVIGESAAPRYRHGEIVYMHPNRPISKGCWVFVQLGDPDQEHGPTKRALIKEYVRQTATKLIISQLNPAKTFDIDLSRVKSIHRIVASGEP